MNEVLTKNNLFNLYPHPSWVYEIDTFTILDVNKAALDQFGYSKEEFTGLTLHELRPEQTISDIEAEHNEIEKTYENFYFGVKTHQKRNGEMVRLEINGHLLDLNGSICALVFCQDVTEQENQQLRLQESEAKLKAATSIAKLGYWNLDIKTNKLSWSDEVYDIWGVEKDSFDLTYENFIKTIHPDDQESFTTELNMTASGQKLHDFVHRIICPDSSIRWVHGLGHLVKDENNQPLMFEGTVQDITSLKEEEQRQKMLESVVINTTDAVLITEADPFDHLGHRIIYVNEAFTRITGYTSDEVIGKTPKILQGPLTDKTELSKINNALRNWESCEATVINYNKDGEEFWLNMSISPVADKSGRYTHWIAIERDVTQQKNKELKQHLIAQISKSFNLSINIIETGSLLCKDILSFGEFQFVELWATNLEQIQMHLLSHEIADTSIQIFYNHGKQTSQFKKSVGLPGKVWEEKSQLLWSGDELKEKFKRYKAASTVDIQSVLGIPLLHDHEVVGVLVIGSKQNKSQMKKLAHIFSSMEEYLGSKLYRKKLESDLGHMFDTLPDIICVTNLEGKFLKINRAFCELIGYDEEEILYTSFKKFVHPDDEQISRNDLESLRKGEKSEGFENRYITKNGKIVWLSWTSRASLKEELIYASAKNITERKKLRELHHQAGKLAKIGGWEVDLISGENHWSDVVHQLHETNPLSFIPDLETSINFYRTDFQRMVKEKVERCIQTGEGFDFEAVLITAKNNELWVRAIGNAEMRYGKAVRIYGSFQDIHDRKIAEQRLQSISDDLPGVTFQYVVQPDGTDFIRSVSLASKKIWQLSPAECEADNERVWIQVKKGGDYEKVKQSISRSVASGEKWNLTWRNVLPSGELRWHEGFGTPNKLADGTVVFNSLIFDITEEKRATLLYEETSRLAQMGSWEVDLSTKVVYFSKVTREIHEIEEDRKINLEEAINFYRDDYKELIQKNIDKGIALGEPWEVEAPIITGNGNERWIRAIGQVEKIEGQPRRIYGSVQDIHERKLTELRLHSIANNLPGVVFQYHLYPDGTDKLLSVSKGSEKIWQLTPQECESHISLVWNQIKGGGDYEKVVAEISHSVKTKTQWHSRWRNVLPDGSIRWHEGYGTPYFLPDGTVVYNSMVFDITDEKKAINLYNEASNLARIGSWERIINYNSPDEVYWSSMLKNILEVDKDYIPSPSNSLEFYEETSRVKFKKALDYLIEKGEIFDLELQIVTAKNKVIWVRCIGKSEFINGQCHRVYGSIQDITNRKTAETQLKSLTDNLPGVVFQYLRKAEGTDHLLYISEGCQELWGLSPGECRDHPEKIWQQIERGGDIEEVKESIDTSAKNLSVWNTSWKNISPNGVVRYYQGIGTPQKMPDGAILWNSLILNITDQVLFQQNYLREQAERISILESISDAFYALDENWKFTYFNKEAENLLNKRSEDVLGNCIWEVFEPAKGTILEERYRRVSKSGNPESFEYYYPGDNSWYDINVYPANNGITSYFKNIDERRKAKEDLLKAYEEKETILESIGDAFFAVDTDWNVNYWNKEAEKLLGKKREDVIGKNLWEVYADAIDTDFYRQYHIARESGEAVTFEEYYSTLCLWFEVSAYPSEDGLSVYFKDITLRKEMDIRLKRANERFEKVAEATNDAIWDWNLKENTLYWGRGFQKLFGHDVENNTPKMDLWMEHIHPKDRVHINRSLQKVLQTKQSTWQEEYRYMKSDGSFAFVIDRGLVIRDVDGEPVRMVGAMTDITTRRQHEKRLIELNKTLEKHTKELERSNVELEQFAYVTSHDLQEPLRMISSFMDLLKRKYGDQLDEKGHQYIHFAVDGAKRMKRIILDLLEYSRANSSSSEQETVDLNLLLEEYLQLRRKIIKESSAVIIYKKLPSILSDRAALTQILYNLLDNALKYVQEDTPPKVHICCTDKNDKWEIKINDNGLGINPEFFDKIFLIFQRLHNKEDYEGTGIGLSIVKKQVENLGGEIWVKSGPGKGSTFYFTIPKT